MSDLTLIQDEANDSEKIRADADKISNIIRESYYLNARSLKKAHTLITEAVQHNKNKAVTPEDQDYINDIVRHSYTAVKYESRIQRGFSVGKALLIGAIAAVPATFIAAEISYRNKEDNLEAREAELRARLSHNKKETPVIGYDKLGDMVVTQGNTGKMLTETKNAITVLHQQGRTIDTPEIGGGVVAGMIIAQLAMMTVHGAWKKTAKSLGQSIADRFAPLPKKHVSVLDIE